MPIGRKQLCIVLRRAEPGQHSCFRAPSSVRLLRSRLSCHFFVTLTYAVGNSQGVADHFLLRGSTRSDPFSCTAHMPAPGGSLTAGLGMVQISTRTFGGESLPPNNYSPNQMRRTLPSFFCRAMLQSDPTTVLSSDSCQKETIQTAFCSS